MNGLESPNVRPEMLVRTMQIIAFALLLGAGFFLAIVLYLPVQGHGQEQPPEAAGSGLPLPVLTLVGVVMAVTTIPLSFVVPGLLLKSQLQAVARARVVQGDQSSADNRALYGGAMTTMIIGLALLEGTSFMGSLAYLLERHPAALAVSVVPLVLMLLRFPTAPGVQSWVEQQKEELSRLRSQAGAPGTF